MLLVPAAFVPQSNAGLSSFTLLNSAISGTTTSIDIASIGTLEEDDLCIIWTLGTGTPSDSTPSGFTKLRTTGASNRQSIFAKRLDGTETTVNGLAGSSRVYVCAVFRPNAPWTSFTDHDTGNNEQTTGNPASQTITAAGESAPVIAYGAMGSPSNAISPRTTSPTMAELTSGSNSFYAHYLIYDVGDTPANITYDMADEGAANYLQSGYLTFT